MYKILITDIICNNQYKDTNPRILTTVVSYDNRVSANEAYNSLMKSNPKVPNEDCLHTRDITKLY